MLLPPVPASPAGQGMSGQVRWDLARPKGWIQGLHQRQQEDEDWEKVEAEDGEEGDHGIQQLNESQFLENPDVPSRKRKAEDDNHKPEIQ